MRGKLSPKVTKKKGAGKNQPPSNEAPAAGKKRKKKLVKGDSASGQGDPPQRPSQVARVVSGEICSSSSSMDKPTKKQGRFDCSSSDAMSTDHARSSSSIVMDSVSEPAHTTRTHLSAPPPSITSPSLTSDTSTADARNPSNKTLERHHDSSSVTMDRSRDSGRSPEATCCQQQPDCTDRWLGSCSDDEQETKRLEVYKENRRKRYTNALEQKLCEHPRTTEYYSTS